MTFGTSSKIVHIDVDVLKGSQLKMFQTEIEMLHRLRRVGNVHILRCVKNTHSKYDVLCRLVNAVTPLTAFGKFAFHVMVWLRI